MYIKAEKIKQSTEAKARKGHHVEPAKKGAAPAFVFGLEDMDLHVGERAAVAGKLARRMHFLSFLNRIVLN